MNASSADLWAGYPGTQSVNFGRTVSADAEMRLRMDPEVVAVEPYQWVDGDWTPERVDAGSVSIYLSGIAVGPDAMLFSKLLSPDLRASARAGAVIVDSADLESLGVAEGGKAWINGHPVRVVAAIAGLRGLGGVNVLASLDSARVIGGPQAGRGSTYYVARLADPSRAPAVQARLAQSDASFGPLQVWTAQEFAQRSQQYWLLDTGAGMAVLFPDRLSGRRGDHQPVLRGRGGGVGARVRHAERARREPWRAGPRRNRAGLPGGRPGHGAGGRGQRAAAGGGRVLSRAGGHDVDGGPGCAALVALMALMSSVMAVRGLIRTDPAPAAALMETVMKRDFSMSPEVQATVEPSLEAFRLGKAFLSGVVKVQVLQGLSLAVYPGELTLISGPSGCGKSTLLSLLSGLQHPDDGKAHALGQDLGAMSRRDLERFRLHHTGFVFQGFNLFPALTALEQVQLPLGYLGMRDQESARLASRALDEVGMASGAHAPGAAVRRRETTRPRAPRARAAFATNPPARGRGGGGRPGQDRSRRRAGGAGAGAGRHCGQPDVREGDRVRGPAAAGAGQPGLGRRHFRAEAGRARQQPPRGRLPELKQAAARYAQAVRAAAQPSWPMTQQRLRDAQSDVAVATAEAAVAAAPEQAGRIAAARAARAGGLRDRGRDGPAGRTPGSGRPGLTLSPRAR